MINKLRGQGLIEAMIVLLIITVSIFSVLQYQKQLFYQSNTTKQSAEASSLAVKQIETLRDYLSASDYSDISSGQSTSTISGTTYTVTWTVTEFTDDIDYKSIHVVVSYADKNGVTQTLNMATDIGVNEPLTSAAVMSGVGGALY